MFLTFTTPIIKQTYRCLIDWFLKDSTNFYDHPNIDLPWWFGMMCFSYSIGGLMSHFGITEKCRMSCKNSKIFPYETYSCCLIFVVGPLCFAADYLNLTNASIFHILDRFFACFTAILESTRIICMFYCVHQYTSFFNCIAFSCAIGCFIQSQNAQSNYDRENFIFWHNAWHTYPLITSVLVIIDQRLLTKQKLEASPSSLSSVNSLMPSRDRQKLT